MGLLVVFRFVLFGLPGGVSLFLGVVVLTAALVAVWELMGVIFLIMLAAANAAGVLLGVVVFLDPPLAWGVGEMTFGAVSSSSSSEGSPSSESEGGGASVEFGRLVCIMLVCKGSSYLFGAWKRRRRSLSPFSQCCRFLGPRPFVSLR